MEDISLSLKREEKSLDSSITMSVTSLVGKGDDKKAYVLFKDKDRMAEFTCPEVEMKLNIGFTDDEINKLVDYVKSEKDYIMSIAKNVNPMKAFMGMKQG